MMKHVIVAKASPIGDQVIDRATIEIAAEVPEFSNGETSLWGERVRAYYDEQARFIVECLLHLPGGTLDRVLAKLITRSVSLHRIPWDGK